MRNGKTSTERASGRRGTSLYAQQASLAPVTKVRGMVTGIRRVSLRRRRLQVERPRQQAAPLQVTSGNPSPSRTCVPGYAAGEKDVRGGGDERRKPVTLFDAVSALARHVARHRTCDANLSWREDVVDQLLKSAAPFPSAMTRGCDAASTVYLESNFGR